MSTKQVWGDLLLSTGQVRRVVTTNTTLNPIFLGGCATLREVDPDAIPTTGSRIQRTFYVNGEHVVSFDDLGVVEEGSEDDGQQHG